MSSSQCSLVWIDLTTPLKVDAVEDEGNDDEEDEFNEEEHEEMIEWKQVEGWVEFIEYFRNDSAQCIVLLS